MCPRVELSGAPSLLWEVVWVGGKHGDKAGVMGSCPLYRLFLAYSSSLPWSLWEASREQGLPQGCGGGFREAPGWASLEGRVGVGFVHRVPRKGGPFLFYTINIHHLLCLTVFPAFHPWRP